MSRRLLETCSSRFEMLRKTSTSLILLILALTSMGAWGAYYVDSVGGSDRSSGTSQAAPWRTLDKVSSTTFGPGDGVRFKRGCQFRGMLILHGNGTTARPITIDAYGTGSKPVILGDSTVDGGTNGAILLRDLTCYQIQNLEIQAPCTSGIILQGCSHVIVRDCDFTNIKYLPPGTPEGDDGWAICIRNGTTDGSYNTVAHCTFKKCLKGVIIFAGDHVVLQDSYFYDIHDIPALFAGHCVGRTVTNSRIKWCVFDYTNTTGLGWNPVMFGGTDNCYQEYCETKNTPAGKWDHQVYDFDTNCKNSYIQYNYSHDNFGDLMHSYWVGDATGNGPCYFRYNISVNDKTLYNSVKTTYGLQMYNNTFYDFGGNFGRDIVASDLSDTVVKNNIFRMKPGAGIDSLPAGSDYNCYVNCTKPSGEAHSIQADPRFVNSGNPPSGLQIKPSSACAKLGIGAPAPPPSPNLALHCTVASSSSSEKEGWSASKVVDGTINTEPNTRGWCSSGNDTVDHREWITLDLGKICLLNRVILYPRNDSGHIGAGFPRNFRIKTSQDSAKWTVVVTQTDYPQPGDAPQYFSFGSKTARYVSIEMTSLRQDADGKYRTALAEIEVLNDKSAVTAVYRPSGNLALNKDVTASSSAENSGWYKAKLVDGMRNSAANAMGWSTTASGTGWVKVDLGAVCSIGKVDLYPRNDSGNVGGGFPVDFTIQLSADNRKWTTVLAKTAYPQPADGRVQSFAFQTRTARYVRVSAANLTDGIALAEIEICE